MGENQEGHFRGKCRFPRENSDIGPKTSKMPCFPGSSCILASFWFGVKNLGKTSIMRWARVSRHQGGQWDETRAGLSLRHMDVLIHRHYTGFRAVLNMPPFSRLPTCDAGSDDSPATPP
jgi:hypothetical protein